MCVCKWARSVCNIYTHFTSVNILLKLVYRLLTAHHTHIVNINQWWQQHQHLLWYVLETFYETKCLSTVIMGKMVRNASFYKFMQGIRNCCRWYENLFLNNTHTHAPHAQTPPTTECEPTHVWNLNSSLLFFLIHFIAFAVSTLWFLYI